MLTIGKNVKVAAQVAVVNRTAGTAVNGTGAARGNYERVCMACVAGAIGVDVTCAFAIEESDDDSSYAAIAGASKTFAAADANKVVLVDAPLSKKYVRATITPGGTVANGVISGAHLMLYSGDNLPVVNSPASVVV